MDTGRCTRCIIQLTHSQAKSGWKPEEYSFSTCVCVCVCVCVWMYSRVCVCAWLNNIACQESPREIPFSFFLFLWAQHVTQPTPASIDSVSQTSTTYLPAATLLLRLAPPSTPNPINDTGPGKRERRAGDRHEMWHEMQKRSPSDTQSGVHRRFSLAAEPTVWLTSGMPRRTGGSCSWERRHDWMEKKNLPGVEARGERTISLFFLNSTIPY